MSNDSIRLMNCASRSCLNMSDFAAYTALLEDINRISGQDGLIVSRRLMDESRELQDAVIRGRRAEVLDELADTVFFTMRLALMHGISVEQVFTYGERKVSLRNRMGKDKPRELSLARQILEKNSDRTV